MCAPALQLHFVHGDPCDSCAGQTSLFATVPVPLARCCASAVQRRRSPLALLDLAALRSTVELSCKGNVLAKGYPPQTPSCRVHVYLQSATAGIQLSTFTARHPAACTFISQVQQLANQVLSFKARHPASMQRCTHLHPWGAIAAVQLSTLQARLDAACTSICEAQQLAFGFQPFKHATKLHALAFKEATADVHTTSRLHNHTLFCSYNTAPHQ